MAEITITKSNFETEVINSDRPVLIDFWATWCGPCRMQAPILARFEEEFGKQVKVGKVNVDEEMELAIQFGISSIPTLVVFKNGSIAAKTVGLSNREELMQLLGI